MNNFLKNVLKKAQVEVQKVEAEVKAFEQKFVAKLTTEEKALWTMARADLEKFASAKGVVDSVKKTTDAIIVELKKLGLVK